MTTTALDRFSYHIWEVLSQRPHTTYHNLPLQLMEEFRVADAEEAEYILDGFDDRNELLQTIRRTFLMRQEGLKGNEFKDPITAVNFVVDLLLRYLLHELFFPVPENENTSITHSKWEDAWSHFSEDFDVETLFDDLYWCLREETM